MNNKGLEVIKETLPRVIHLDRVLFANLIFLLLQDMAPLVFWLEVDVA